MDQALLTATIAALNEMHPNASDEDFHCELQHTLAHHVGTYTDSDQLNRDALDSYGFDPLQWLPR